MVALTIRHSVQWQAPMPLWAENSSTGIRVMNQDQAAYPSILRFANDSFMDDLLAVMQNNPKRLNEWLVQAETWRDPSPTPASANPAGDTDSIAFLLNQTKQLADQQKPTPKTLLSAPKQAVSINPASRTDGAPIKLFHSTHQRFYLVSASLICACPGYPDQPIDRGHKEQASFVMRRVVPPKGSNNPAENVTVENLADWDEYALVTTNNGPRWMRVGKNSDMGCRKLIDNEEKLPLFPVNYKDNCKHDRRLLNGLIPVGKREQWMAAPIGDAYNQQLAASQGLDFDIAIPRAQIIFQMDVSEPWKALVEHGENKKQGFNRGLDNFETSGDAGAETARALRTLRDNMQMAAWYVLLDFAKFLEQRLPAVWSVSQQLVANPALQADEFDLSDPEITLLNTIAGVELSNNLIDALVDPLEELKNLFVGPVPAIDIRREQALADSTVKRNLLQALVAVRPLEADLEAVENEFLRFNDEVTPPVALSIDPKWPDFLFPLADPALDGPIPNRQFPTEALDMRLLKIDELAELIGEILPAPDETGDFINPATALDQRNAWFVVRCVYERPDCGPLFPPLVSEASRLFQMAAFFDPDAPARPIRIPMPVDISPAGLRKYKKNTAFVMSDMLCGKIKKIRKISLGDLVLSVLPWPFHKDLPDPGDTGPCGGNGPNFGMICSLSIPIVTLCALILLMIMVALFDLFFRWIPFLFMCLPIPGFKGKP